MYYSNKKLALSIFWVIAGVTLMVLSIAEVLDSSVWSGMGGAFTAVGVLQIIRNIRYRKDPAYREKIDTEVSDERNNWIRMKSWTWTGIVVIIVEGIAGIVAMILGELMIQQILSYSVCLILCVYWISWLILSRKY